MERIPKTRYSNFMRIMNSKSFLNVMKWHDKSTPCTETKFTSWVWWRNVRFLSKRYVWFPSDMIYRAITWAWWSVTRAEINTFDLALFFTRGNAHHVNNTMQYEHGYQSTLSRPHPSNARLPPVGGGISIFDTLLKRDCFSKNLDFSEHSFFTNVFHTPKLFTHPFSRRCVMIALVRYDIFFKRIVWVSNEREPKSMVFFAICWILQKLQNLDVYLK